MSLSNDESNIKEWSKCYVNKTVKIINPNVDRLASNAEKNNSIQFFNFYIDSIDIDLKQIEKSIPETPDIKVHITLLDLTYKQYFGRTWVGPLKQLNKSISDYDESVYFSTSFNDPNILLVIELIAQCQEDYLSLGWTALRIFDSESNENLKKLNIYNGSPRALLFMDEHFEKNQYLKTISNSFINYSLVSKPKLSSFKQFIPENVLFGSEDRIGAIGRGAKKHPLDKPTLLPTISLIIDELTIIINPTVSKFETEFRRLLADDKLNWDKLEVDPSTISITERRLKVGVHNGWKYINEPHILHLNIDDPALSSQTQLSSNKRVNLKSSFKQKSSNESDPNTSTSNRLKSRNSVVLNQTFDDPMCAVVFELEYVVSIPLQVNILNNKNNKKPVISDTKKQNETHHILTRWAVYCPFATNKTIKSSKIEVNLLGGGSHLIHPEGKLVFKQPDDESSSGQISFIIRKGDQVNYQQKQQEQFAQESEEDEKEVVHKSPRHRQQLQQQQHSDMEEIPQLVEKRKNQQTSEQRQMNDSLRQKSIMDVYNQMIPRQDDFLQSSQANLLMSQIVSRASESQRLVGLFGGNLELYPVYNPNLHMPILALSPGQIGGRTMSRAAYAKLQSAKFPPITDRFGKMAEVIDGNSYVKFDLQKEEADMLTCNQIIIQFLAFSRTIDSLMSSQSEARPRSIFLTFQFYRFPEFKTPKLALDKIMEDYSTDSDSTPFILKTIETDKNHPNDKSGFMIYYSVDPTNLKFGEKKQFLQYLAHHAMFIDVWDANSLHLIGTATLQLKELLRQGREAVQSTYELDIISTEYDDDSRLNSGNTYREGVPYSSDSHIKQKGLLHVRIANVGSPVENPSDTLQSSDLAPTLPFTRVIASKSSLNAFGENLLARKIDEVTTQGFLTHNMSKAHHMAETFKDIHAALVSHNNKSISDAADAAHDSDPLKKRKLSRMQMVRRLKDNPSIQPLLIGNHNRVIEQRSKDLRIMEFYRNQTKHDQIMNKLNEFITTEYAIYPNYGIVEFFEFVITNPFNDSQVITIMIEDPDIQVVTNSKEWRHLKLLHQIYSQVEDDMFHREEIDPNQQNIKYPQLFLRPKETINIPFKFQTFKANNQVDTNDLNFLMKQTDSMIRNVPSKYELKRTNIWFRAQDKNPIAILRLIIDQQPHVVNQTFRFNECEHSFLKKTIRLPSSTRALATDSTSGLADIQLEGTSNEPGVSQLYVRSSDPNVVCESRPVTRGEPHDIFIKAATGSSPQVKKFYIAIYADQYLAIPLQIWQIYVHSMHRIDVSCTQGQTSRFSLILKGTQSSRLVKCFASVPEEMSLVPHDKFMLGSSAVQELNVGVQPFKSGVKHYYLNVVDIETSYLVHSWFIYVNCKPPVISKSFELQLPVCSGGSVAAVVSQKRVSYTNPYATEKYFVLSTNRDDLLTFKERRIKLMANEQKTLALKFLPCPMPGFVEIYVFINNDNDSNEETFSLRVHYIKQNVEQSY